MISVVLCVYVVCMLSCSCMWCSCLFFFFKQKTAYEMRISDWSSDVCSSDLRGWLKRFPDSFRPLAFSVKRMIGDGADVIALGRFRHRVVPTGAIVDSDYAIRFTIRDRKSVV